MSVSTRPAPAGTAVPAPRSSDLTGTGKLVRLILRRDRWLLVWWLVLALYPASAARSLDNLYPTAADLQRFADDMLANSALTALYGQLHGASLGEVTAWRIGSYPAILGLLSLLVVIRHTRVEEAAGRRELVGSTAVGRHAGLVAALSVTFLINIVVALVIAATLRGAGLPGAGSLAVGAQFAVGGCVFAAVGGLAAQLTTSPMAARGIALGTLGVTFLVRALGDVSAVNGGALGWLTWLSPIGWAQQIRAYDSNRWWVLLVALAAVAVLSATAVAVSARRDIGSGVIDERPGPATAAPGLRSAGALARRLQRGSLLGWLVAFAVAGLLYGSVARTVADSIDDDGNGRLRDVLARLGGTGAAVDAWLSAMMGLMAILAAGYAIQAARRLDAEESGQRSEILLATATGRLRWAAGHLVFAFVGPALLLAVGALAAAATSGEAGRQTSRLLGAGLAQLPAVWVLAAVTVALFGLLPRLAAAAWGALALCVLLGDVGAALDLPQGLLDVSPFTHTPKLPGGDFSAMPLIVLTAVAVVVTAVGLTGLRRRDMPAN